MGYFLAGVKHTHFNAKTGSQRSHLLWNTFQGGLNIKMIIKGTMESAEGQSNNVQDSEREEKRGK